MFYKDLTIDEKFLDENGNLLPELKKFNWGAFLFTGIWCLWYKTWKLLLVSLLLYFLVFMRYIGSLLLLVFRIYCGIKGNEWALKVNNEFRWKDSGGFNDGQKNFIFNVLVTFLLLPSAMVIITMLRDGNSAGAGDVFSMVFILFVRLFPSVCIVLIAFIIRYAIFLKKSKTQKEKLPIKLKLIICSTSIVIALFFLARNFFWDISTLIQIGKNTIEELHCFFKV